jgi:hypothetical protein
MNNSGGDAMTVKAYMIFRQQDGSYLKSESQVVFQKQTGRNYPPPFRGIAVRP